MKKLLAERGIELISAVPNEVPGVYKDIDTVMAAQTNPAAAREQRLATCLL